MQTRLAAEDVKALSRPQTPEAFELKLPAEFVPPVGIQFTIDETNQIYSQARAWALKHGLTQEAFSEGLALIAGDRVGTAQQNETARQAEIAKLGPAAVARVTAVETWLAGQIGGSEARQLMTRLALATDIQHFEKLVTKVTRQGAAPFSAGGREPPPAAGKVSDDAYLKMTHGERMDYARQFPQQSQPNGRGA